MDDFKTATDVKGDIKGYSETQTSPPPYSSTATSSAIPDDAKRPAKPLQSTNVTASGSNTRRVVVVPGSWPVLPPPCNYLIERSSNGSVNGTWHVDTGLAIPEPLLPPFSQFDGTWNREAQNARKKRDKEQKKRDGWWSKRVNGDLPPLPPIKEVRPNLMLYSNNGSVSGKIYALSSDGITRQALIVAQGHNGSVNLTVNAVSAQPVRIHASSNNGSVTVKIPTSYEGAVVLSSFNGTIKMSDGIKSKSTIFTTSSNTTRFFIGDWQASGFGSAPDTSAFGSHAAASSSNAPQRDPFTMWSGPLIYLTSTNGSTHLSFVDEDFVTTLAAGISKAVRNVMSGIFGGA